MSSPLRSPILRRSKWSKTSRAVDKLQKLLKCGLCKELVIQPHVVGSCEHMFCKECIKPFLGKFCPECKIPAEAKEMQHDIVMTDIVTKSAQLSSTLGRYSLRSKGPGESNSQFKGEGEEQQPLSPLPTPASPPRTLHLNGGRSRNLSKAVSPAKIPERSPTLKKGGRPQSSPSKNCSPTAQQLKTASSPVSKGGGSSPAVSPRPKSMGSPGVKSPRSPSPHTTVATEFKLSSPRLSLGGSVGNHTVKVSVSPSPKGTGSPNAALRKAHSHHRTPNSVHRTITIFDRVRKRRRRGGLSLSRGGGVAGRGGDKTNASPVAPAAGASPQQSVKRKLEGADSPTGKKVGSVGAGVTQSPAGITLKRNSKGETPLHLATIKGEVAVVRALLDQGANPNVKDNAGWTPLHEACHHGHLELVDLLLNRGALVNLTGFENETALHDAVVMNEHAIAAILVSWGANKHARNSRGLTPLDLSANCTPEMKKALKTPCSHSTDSSEIILNQQPQATTVMLLGTGLDVQQQDDLQVCADILKGKVVTEFNDQVTHLITVCDDDGRCQRTLKFLLAILKGKWILNFTWVDECIAFNRRVFEEPFEIIGTKQHALMFGPKHARANSVNQFPPLFDGCSFYLDGNFVTPSLNKEYLAMLIRHGGGTVLTRDPRRHSLSTEARVIPYHAPPSGELSNVRYFVVSQLATSEIRDSVCNVSSSWLLACISSFKLLPLDFEEK